MRQLITNDGDIISDQQEIIMEQTKYYTELYSSEATDGSYREELINNLSKSLPHDDLSVR